MNDCFVLHFYLVLLLLWLKDYLKGLRHRELQLYHPPQVVVNPVPGPIKDTPHPHKPQPFLSTHPTPFHIQYLYFPSSLSPLSLLMPSSFPLHPPLHIQHSSSHLHPGPTHLLSQFSHDFLSGPTALTISLMCGGKYLFKTFLALVLKCLLSNNM